MSKYSIENVLGMDIGDSNIHICVLDRDGDRIASGGGKAAKSRAVVAVARKLAVLMHHLWKNKAVYDPFYSVKTMAG